MSFVAACGDSDDDGGGTEKFDDWNDPKSPNYKPEGYNPIVGMWQHKASEGREIFTEDFKYRTIFINNNGEWSEPTTRADYIINDKKMKTSKFFQYLGGGDEFAYHLEKEDGKDVLYLGTLKYYRVTE